MTDFATLFLKVDSTGMLPGDAALDRIAAKGAKAEVDVNISMRGIEAAMEKAAKAMGMVAAAMDKGLAQTTAAGQAQARTFEELRRAIDPVYAANVRYAEISRETAALVSAGSASQRQANELLEQARSRYLGVATAAEQLARVEREKLQATAAAAQGYQALRASVDPLYASSKRYEAALETLEVAQRAGIITDKDRVRTLQLLEAQMIKTDRGAGQAGAGVGKFGYIANQLGFQLQDVFVSAPLVGWFRAVSQQAPQAAGAFAMLGGTMGTVIPWLGTAIAVGAAVGPMFFNMGQKANQAQDAVDALTTSLNSFEQYATKARGSASALFDEFGIGAARGRELYEALAMLERIKFEQNLSASVAALGVSLEGVTDLIGQWDYATLQLPEALRADALNLAGDAAEKLRTEYGLTLAQARQVTNAVGDVRMAKGPEEAAKAASELARSLLDAHMAGAKLPPELIDAARNAAETGVASQRMAAMLGFARREAGGLPAPLTQSEQLVYGLASGAQSALNSLGLSTGETWNWASAMSGVKAELLGILSVVSQIGGGLIARASKFVELNALRAGKSVADARVEVERFNTTLEWDKQISTVDDSGVLGWARRKALEAGKALDLANMSMDATIAVERKAASESEKAAAKGGKARASASEKAAKALTKEQERWEDLLDPMAKYRREMTNLAKLQGELTPEIYAKAQKYLNDQLGESIPLVGDLSDAWADFVLSGGKSISGLGDMFKGMLRQMIADAARQQIMIAMGVLPVGSAAPGQVGGAPGGTTGASGVLGNISSVLGKDGWLMKGLTSGKGILGSIGSFFNIGGAAGASGGLMASMAGVLGTVGAVLGGVGLVISLGKKLFGRTLKDTGVEGTFSGDDFEGNSFKFYKGGLLRSNKTKRSPLDEATEDAIALAYGELRGGVKEMAAVLGIGSKSIRKFSYDFKISTKGMTEDQIIAALQDEMGAAGAEMAKLILGTTKFTKAGETALETLERLSGALSVVNPAMGRLGLTVYGASAAGGQAASKFADLFGGLDAFASAASYYYDTFYTLAERHKNLRGDVGDVLGDLGIKTIPKTQAQFRALIERLDAAGRSKGVAALMKIAPAFVEMLEMGTELAGSKDGKGLSDAARSERAGLEKQLLTLQGNTAALRKLELGALDPANRALQRRIWGLEREQAISRERETLERQLLTLQGKTGALRKLELAELEPANRALQRRIWALEKEQAISKERDGLEKQLLTALGDTNALRKLEVSALYGANRSLQRWLYRLDDAQSLADAATEAFKRSADAERSRIDDLLSMSESLRSSAVSAREAVFGLSEVQRLAAERQLRTAIQTGRVWDSALEGFAEKALNLNSSSFGSKVDYLLASARASATVAGLAGAQERAANTAEARLEAALKRYGLQDETVLGLTAAMTKLDNALSNLSRVQAAAAAAYGITLPAFASGGLHAGGLRIVGENGPEIEATGASRIYNQAQMREILSGREAGVSEAVLQAILSQISAMRKELVSLNIDTAENTRKIKDMTRQWDNVGVKVKVLP